jgi:hypothetical protein
MISPHAFGGIQVKPQTFDFDLTVKKKAAATKTRSGFSFMGEYFMIFGPNIFWHKNSKTESG